MQLYDLVDPDELGELYELGYIREQSHPTEPLAILTYSDKAQIEGQTFWEAHPALSVCRGLIYNTENGEIVARPFPKFWNYGQGAAAKIDMAERVYTMDKMDGSLGIMYREPNGGDLAIATRGSFTSDQALHATLLLRTEYQMSLAGPRDPRERYHAADDETFLFEIVYPANRIVIDYKGADELFLLGSVGIEDGYISTPEAANIHLDWTGWTTQTFQYSTLGEALAAPPRPNAEGFVVATPGGKKMVKIKQEDYIALHRIVTGLSERRVWQALMAGQSVSQILEPLPDELHDWTRQVAQSLMDSYNTIRNQAERQLMDVFADARENYWVVTVDDQIQVTNRKMVALLIKDKNNPGLLFPLLDGRDIDQAIWKMIEPKGDNRPYNTNKED